MTSMPSVDQAIEIFNTAAEENLLSPLRQQQVVHLAGDGEGGGQGIAVRAFHVFADRGAAAERAFDILQHLAHRALGGVLLRQLGIGDGAAARIGDGGDARRCRQRRGAGRQQESQTQMRARHVRPPSL